MSHFPEPPVHPSQSFRRESSNVADRSTLHQVVAKPVASVAVAVVAAHMGRSRPAARATNLAVAAAPDLLAAKIWLYPTLGNSNSL